MQYVPDFLSGTGNELTAYETGAGSVRTVVQYAERGVWGNLKDGTEILSGLEENLRFTSYHYAR